VRPDEVLLADGSRRVGAVGWAGRSPHNGATTAAGSALGAVGIESIAVGRLA
jgi:hypothetical protein